MHGLNVRTYQWQPYRADFCDRSVYWAYQDSSHHRLADRCGIRRVLVSSAQEHHELIEAMRARDTAATKSLINSHIKHIRGLWVGREEK